MEQKGQKAEGECDAPDFGELWIRCQNVEHYADQTHEKRKENVHFRLPPDQIWAAWRSLKMGPEFVEVIARDSIVDELMQNFLARDSPGFVEQSKAGNETELIAEARALTEVRPRSFRRDLLV